MLHTLVPTARNVLAVGLTVVVCLSARHASAGDSTAAAAWPSWRGPLHNGVVESSSAPLTWDKQKNVRWRLPLPGPAGSTPVVWEDRVFLTSVDDGKLVLICVSTSGKQLWTRAVTQGNRNVRGDEGNFASPSPVVDDEHVYASFGNGVVAAFDFAGEPVWTVDLAERYGPLKVAFGWSSSPVLYDGRLCFQLIHGDGKANTQEAVVVALDAATGDEIWKVQRVTGAYNENEHSYASAVLFPFGDQPYLITHGADYTIAYNFEDGSERWRLGGLNPQDDPRKAYHRTLRFVASPGCGEKTIVIPTAKNERVVAIDADAKGSITATTNQTKTAADSPIRWVLGSGTPDVPSPLVHEGIVYLCRENGNLQALDEMTGKEIYLQRTHRTRHRASPVLVDGRLYLTARDGRVTVVKAGREFEVLSQNDLGEPISSSPAVAGDVLYLRTFNALYAIAD